MPLDAHITRYLSRTSVGFFPVPPRELSGPYLPITTKGVRTRTKLVSMVSQTRLNPCSVPINYATVTFSSDHPDFAALHMKMFGA